MLALSAALVLATASQAAGPSHPDYPGYAWKPTDPVEAFLTFRTREGCLFYDARPGTQAELNAHHREYKTVYEWIGPPCTPGQGINGEGALLRTYVEPTGGTHWSRMRGTMEDGYWQGPAYYHTSYSRGAPAQPNFFYFGGCGMNVDQVARQYWGVRDHPRCKPRPPKRPRPGEAG